MNKQKSKNLLQEKNYTGIDCMFFSCHVRISEPIHTLYLPQCQETPCSKQKRYLKLKRLQQDSNPQPLSSSTNTQPFGQTDHMIQLSCEHLSLRWI